MTRLPALQWLSARGNRLSGLPDSIGNCKKLKVLDLSFNAVSGLPQSIAACCSLTVLRIAHNRLCDMPPAIKPFIDKIDSGWQPTQECGKK